MDGNTTLMELDNLIDRNKIAPAVARQVSMSLLERGYHELYINVVPIIILASIVLWGFDSVPDKAILWTWYLSVIVLTLIRSIIAIAFNLNQKHEQQLSKWQGLFLLSLFLGAVSWGSIGVFLWPMADSLQKTLSLIIVAGVTAGAIITISTMRIATFIFLIPIILPFIIQTLFHYRDNHDLLGVALILYLGYLIILSLRVNASRTSTIYLQFENDKLLTDLEKLATHDALTHADNSLLFHINLVNAIKRAKRKRKLIALLYIDLDNFKLVNDNYGHDAGDLVLVEVTNRIKSFLRESDLFARIGGDEFTVIVEQVEDRSDVILIAQRICKSLAEPMSIEGHTVYISACIGISFYPDDGHEAKILIKAADDAMYYVKTHGRNNYHFTSYKAPNNLR
jgi:diguanylate cyclase (GGDEF)-like protein